MRTQGRLQPQGCSGVAAEKTGTNPCCDDHGLLCTSQTSWMYSSKLQLNSVKWVISNHREELQYCTLRFKLPAGWPEATILNMVSNHKSTRTRSHPPLPDGTFWTPHMNQKIKVSVDISLSVCQAPLSNTYVVNIDVVRALAPSEQSVDLCIYSFNHCFAQNADAKM